MTTEAEYHEKLRNFLRAAAARSGRSLVPGGPGTGKSRVLARRVKFLLLQGVSPHEICLVTCGETSAEPLRDQFTAVEVDPELSEQIFVGNIHTLAALLLREAGAEVLGVNRFFTVWTWEQAAQAMGPVWAAEKTEALPEAEVRALIAWDARKRRIHDDMMSHPPEHATELGELYRREKRRRDVLDPQDLIDHAIAALENDRHLRDEWRRTRARHLMVDHFEDVTKRQYRLISLLVGPETKLMVTVDPNQSCSEKLGASPSAHQRLALEYPDLTAHPLEVQRRTLFQTFQVARVLPLAAGVPGLHNYDGMEHWHERPGGQPPALVEVHGAASHMDNRILDEVQQAAAAGRPWEAMAILCPRRATMDRLVTKVMGRNIPFHTVGVPLGGEEDSPPAIALLRLALNPKDLDSFAVVAGAAMRGRRRRLPAKLLLQVRAASQRCGYDLVEAARAVNAGVAGSVRPSRELGFVIHAHGELAERMGWPEIDLGDLYAHAEGLISRVQGETLDPQPREAFRDILEHAPREEGERLRDHAARVLDLLCPALHPPTGTGPGVALCLFDGAKGREWDSVWIADAADHIIPGTDDSVGLLDQLRLFYVACSRARDDLSIYYATSQGRGYDAQPSRFLEAVQPWVAHSVVGLWKPPSGDAGNLSSRHRSIYN